MLTNEVAKQKPEAAATKLSRIKSQIILVIFVVAFFALFNIILKGNLLSGENIKSLVSHAVVAAMISWAMVFIFTCGIMDMSMGAILILAANFSGIIGLRFGYAAMIVSAVIISIVLEFINLQCCLRLKIPSWISGIGMAMVFEAIGAIYSDHMISIGQQSIDLGSRLREFGQWPWNGILWVAGMLLAYLLFARSSIGINIRAAGNNRAVSKMMGINFGKTVLLGGIIAGIFLGLASAEDISYSGRIMVQTGMGSINLIFKSLAILMLAQAFEKFMNLAVGVLFGSFIIASLFNILTQFGVPSGTWQEFTEAVLIIIFGILSQVGNKGVVK